MKIVFVSMNKTEEYNSFEEVPYEVKGYTEDLTEIRNSGGCVHRKELDNQPEYRGFLGPMWDGGGLRYETSEVYNLLSM